MAIEDLKRNVNEKFPEIKEIEEVNKKRLMIFIPRELLHPMAKYLFEDLKYRYVIVTAMDSQDGYEIIYHFSDDTSGWVINLNVLLPHDKPEIESLVPVIKGVEWIEREIFDLIGITFLNHPNLKRFLFAESWKDGEYPFRRKHTEEKK